ncbi:unnamed protein product [Caenorhabditis auriculariae]|uniref:RRM domain-containing protein n=1 Tax=Caenorhabditis auriculariae TaxID=2777116 RepID=A0A8S1HF78_9PELO|nr:unnamed protein product [Caenorhabditis auriculariae]
MYYSNNGQPVSHPKIRRGGSLSQRKDSRTTQERFGQNPHAPVAELTEVFSNLGLQHDSGNHSVASFSDTQFSNGEDFGYPVTNTRKNRRNFIPSFSDDSVASMSPSQYNLFSPVEGSVGFQEHFEHELAYFNNGQQYSEFPMEQNYSTEVSQLRGTFSRGRGGKSKNNNHARNGSLRTSSSASFSSPTPSRCSSSAAHNLLGIPEMQQHLVSLIQSQKYNELQQFVQLLSSEPMCNFLLEQSQAPLQNYLPSPKPEKRNHVFYEPEIVHKSVSQCSMRSNKSRVYSNKVFVGGIHPNMSKSIIESFFSYFGNVFFDWPTRTVLNSLDRLDHKATPYLFLVYPEEDSVRSLISHCSVNEREEYFVKVQGFEQYQIQVRPWLMQNAVYFANDLSLDDKIIEIHRTVFVGGLPRIVTARSIAELFSEFGKVLLVNIDVDQDYGYPKGAARVTFEKDFSVREALNARFLKLVDIDSNKTNVEIKPYVMEDVACDECGGLWFNPVAKVIQGLLDKTEKEDVDKTAEGNEMKHSSSWPLSSNSQHNFEFLPERPVSETLGYYNIWSSDYFRPNSAPLPNTLEPDNVPNVAIPTISSSLDDVNALLEMKTLAEIVVELAKELNIGFGEIYDHFLASPAPVDQTRSSFKIYNSQVRNSLEQFYKAQSGGAGPNIKNRSSYCPDPICRQYFCPSCNHARHFDQDRPIFGPEHLVVSSLKNDQKRSRKDKPMYLVQQI